MFFGSNVVYLAKQGFADTSEALLHYVTIESRKHYAVYRNDAFGVNALGELHGIDVFGV